MNNPLEPKKYKVTFGGWYQRTTLHLSEIFDFFAFIRTKLDLDQETLKKYHHFLDFHTVRREAGYLEYVYAVTKSNIRIKYYEDGLYVLEKETNDVYEAKTQLQDFFKHIFEPSLAFLFSKGAPTPKLLANIQTRHPIVVQTNYENHAAFNIDPNTFGQVYSKISADDVSVYKTPEYIFIISDPRSKANVDGLIEQQIFFREFKDQMEKYLDIHRTVWELISEIKQQQYISGRDVSDVRNKLDAYKETVSLITHRVNQAGTYIGTRKSISSSQGLDEYLTSLFQYRFDVLGNTLTYIKDIWAMTVGYLDESIKLVVEIREKATDSSIKSLRLITTIGVVAGLFRYVSSDSFPTISTPGIGYLALLIALTWLAEKWLSKRNNDKRYRIKFKERSKDV